jgi:hypothetical protein
MVISLFLQSHYLVKVECDVPGSNELPLSLPLVLRVPDAFFLGAQVQPPIPAHLPSMVAIRPKWQEDNSSKECQECKKGFSLVARRHHCRHCGRLLCANCCTKYVK